MNSHSMELEGMKRTLEQVKKKLKVLALITDRHGSIRKHIEKAEPTINHYYDPWHVIRSKYIQILYTTIDIATTQVFPHCRR